MLWNDHSKLKDKHSLLSPSQSSWLNYDEEKMINRYVSSFSQTIGTVIHGFAEDHIRYSIKLTKNKKDEALLSVLKKGVPIDCVDMDYIYPNLQSYVNDAIKFKMSPEVALYYSEFCFGHADAISFENSFLRIHDLKTGKSPVHMEQLIIYAALFCLEYGIRPESIDYELRIYQGNEIIGFNPSSEEIETVINKIVSFDTLIRNLRGA